MVRSCRVHGFGEFSQIRKHAKKELVQSFFVCFDVFLQDNDVINLAAQGGMHVHAVLHAVDEGDVQLSAIHGNCA